MGSCLLLLEFPSSCSRLGSILAEKSSITVTGTGSSSNWIDGTEFVSRTLPQMNLENVICRSSNAIAHKVTLEVG